MLGIPGRNPGGYMKVMPNQVIAHRTPAEAWRWAQALISRYGTQRITEDRQNTKEIANLQLQILNPAESWPVDGSGWTIPALNEYLHREILNGHPPEGFRYTYGQRLFAYPMVDMTINQIDDYVIRKLKKEPSTRRAKAAIWHPLLDRFEDSTPCLQDVSFLYDGARLNLTANFRSWDVGRAAIENIYGLAGLLGYVADGACMEPGSLTIMAVSAHIYEI
jgi:thymidylate synthase (methanogen type)